MTNRIIDCDFNVLNFIHKHSDKIIGSLIFLVGLVLIVASLQDVYLMWTYFRVFAWPETLIHVICTTIIWRWGYKVFSHKDS